MNTACLAFTSRIYAVVAKYMLGAFANTIVLCCTVPDAKHGITETSRRHRNAGINNVTTAENLMLTPSTCPGS